MKKLLLLSITLLALTGACAETVDDSQWKSDMEERIKILESKKTMTMMEMMHNEEMGEMMEMEERHKDVEELKEKVSALESEIKELMLQVRDLQEQVSESIRDDHEITKEDIKIRLGEVTTQRDAEATLNYAVEAGVLTQEEANSELQKFIDR